MSRKRRSQKKTRRKRHPLSEQTTEKKPKVPVESAQGNPDSRETEAPHSNAADDPTASQETSPLSLADQTGRQNSIAAQVGVKHRRAKLLFGFLAAVGIVSIPLLHWWKTSLPLASTVAGGLESGQYEIVAESLRKNLKQRITRANKIVGFEAKAEDSRGSLDNLRKLQCGEIDFGLYQVGTLDELREEEFWELDTGGGSDGSSDGRLEENEFREHFAGDNFTAKQIVTRTKNAFRRLDGDRDGMLSMAEFNNVSDVRFVSNLYDDVLHVITLKDGPIRNLMDLQGMRVGFGLKYSGNYAASRMLFRSVGLTVNESVQSTKMADPLGITPFPSEDDLNKRSVKEQALDVYELMHTRLKEGEIDAAVFVVGPDANILAELFKDGDLCLLDLSEQLQAIQHESMEFSGHAISQNEYGKIRPQITFSNGSNELNTVTLRVQLLSHFGVDNDLVKLVTGIVMDEQFQKENGLRQLYTGSVAERESFARNRPGFKIHYGALVFYDGGFNPGEFAGWQAFYSLFASITLAIAVTCRWLWRGRRRQREHRLNQYFNCLFAIEERLLDLDQHARTDDLVPLQVCLDEITRLRHKAMQDFNAHELNDDAAFQTFLQTCHYISQKVNAKLSRQRSGHFAERIVESIDSLTSAIRSKDPSTSEPL
jgi:TRAP-type uncharacterized transport system substrate-binding protein